MLSEAKHPCSSFKQMLGSFAALRMTASRGLFISLLVPLAISASNLRAQNPVPFINEPLVPMSVAPGGPSFMLTVNGTGFVSGATMNWNGAPLATVFVSASQLTANVPAANVAAPGTASVTVVNPSPGGGRSKVVYFQVTRGTASMAFDAMDLLVGYGKINSVTLADFNEDGKLDLAVGRFGSIHIALGNGDGTFGPFTQYNVADGVYSLATGDYDRDGHLDLAGAGAGLVILLGNGDGTFRPPRLYPGDYPTSDDYAPLVAGDFNRDGILDFAVACGRSVSVYLGVGDGTFSPARVYATGSGVFNLVAGGFNGNQFLDLAAANFDSGVVVLFGDGQGGFGPPQTYDAKLPNPDLLSAADLNNDGKLDFAVASGISASILIGNGDGTFQTPVLYPGTAGKFESIKVGDFNGDGQPDLAFAESSTAGSYTRFSILLGNGDGTFQPATPFEVANSSSFGVFTTGDLDGDGRLDIVAAALEDPLIYVLLQAGPVDLFPRSIDFGNQSIYIPSSANTLTLTNHLATPLTVATIALTGADTGDFAESNDCPVSPATLASESSCSIELTFTPAAPGTRTAALVVNTSVGGSLHVPLSGTGIGPAASLSKSSLAFGGQLVATSSAASITVTNRGNQALNIAGVAIAPSGAFALGASGTTCAAGSAVAAGSSCAISVTFAPTAAGNQSAALTLSTDALGSPHTVTLSGTGEDYSLTTDAASKTISAGQPAIFMLGVTPEGGLNQAVALACSGAPTLSTCTVIPASVTLNGASSSSATVTLATTAPSLTSPRGWLWPPMNRRNLPLLVGFLALLVCALAAAAGDRWSPDRRFGVRRFVAAVACSAGVSTGVSGDEDIAATESGSKGKQCLPRVPHSKKYFFSALRTAVLLLTLLWAACGGGGTTTVHNPGTQAGTYSLTLTGTVTAGSNTLQHSITVKVTVQ